MAKMSIRKFNGMVRNAISVPHVSRVRFAEVAIAAAGNTSFTLLTVDDDPNYDLNSDGTTIAEAQPLSRIRNMKLTWYCGRPSAGDLIEWILYKDPDGELGVLAPSTLFTADYTEAIGALRKYTFKYGMIPGSTTTDMVNVSMRISRAAMKRAGVLKDGDLLRLVFANTGAATVLHGYGTITWSNP